jgi:hypothetical protein
MFLKSEGLVRMRYWMCECCALLLVTLPQDDASQYECPQCVKAECEHGGDFGEITKEVFLKEADAR